MYTIIIDSGVCFVARDSKLWQIVDEEMLGFHGISVEDGTLTLPDKISGEIFEKALDKSLEVFDNPPKFHGNLDVAAGFAIAAYLEVIEDSFITPDEQEKHDSYLQYMADESFRDYCDWKQEVP
jgi:hypothetical protein